MEASPTKKVLHEAVDLEAVGSQFYGTTHMNMLGTNNILVVDYMLNWASQHIDNPPAATKCP